MILCTTTPLSNDDRLALWTMMRSAYLNNQRAMNHFLVRPVRKINLAANGQPHRKRGNSSPQGAGQIAKTLLSVVLNIFAAGFLFCAIFYADEWMRQIVEFLK